MSQRAIRPNLSHHETIPMQDPRWQKFWPNLVWYAATMIVLIILLSMLRWPLILAALWLVGLGWGGWLAFKLAQILLGDRTSAASAARSEVVLAQTHDYRDKILAAIDGAPGAASLRADELRRQVNTLTQAIEALVARTSHLRQDEIIRRDSRSVPQAVQELQQRLATEPDPAIKQQLEKTLGNRRQQLEALRALDKTLTRAEIQIESTLSQLGTIYSQLLTSQSTSDVADYNRISTNLDDEVQLLEDQLEALREVKLG